MATDLCFPILKFSHATGVLPNNIIPWTHIQAPDIFAIVKGAHSDAQLTLRIVQGTTVLESIDIGRYVDDALEARRGAQQAGVTPQVDQLPIFGMTKESSLALRYRLADGDARRLQLRMQNPTECREIVAVFERRGMEFQTQRPGTARPITARPVTASNQYRLLTAKASSPYFDSAQSASKPSPFVPQQVEAGSLSRRPPLSREQSSASTHEPRMRSSDMQPPTFIHRDEVEAPREPMVSRPTTAQMYRSYTTPSQQSQDYAVDLPRRPSDPTGERPSSTSHVPVLEAIREAAEEDMATSLMQQPTSGGAPLSSDPAEPRPQTSRTSVSATSVFPETLEHEIPPRRELPFKRPESRQSGSDRSRSTTSAMTMPPLPKPKLVKDGSGSSNRADSAFPAKEPASGRPSTSSLLKRSTEATGSDHRPQTTAGAANDQSRQLPQQSSSGKSLSPQKRALSPEPAARKTSRMDELLYGRPPLADRTTNAKVPRLDSLTDAPHEIVSPPVSPAKATHDPTVNAYAAIRAPSALDLGECSVQEYATQSLQDRQAALEEFMVANLENPAFTKLCEDVENCWRRIALGL